MLSRPWNQFYRCFLDLEECQGGRGVKGGDPPLPNAFGLNSIFENTIFFGELFFSIIIRGEETRFFFIDIHLLESSETVVRIVN